VKSWLCETSKVRAISRIGSPLSRRLIASRIWWAVAPHQARTYQPGLLLVQRNLRLSTHRIDDTIHDALNLHGTPFAAARRRYAATVQAGGDLSQRAGRRVAAIKGMDGDGRLCRYKVRFLDCTI
jgi:hypothetical protein